MPLSSGCVGLEVTTGPLDVPARWLLASAAALGMEDPSFQDDARPVGLLGVPFLCTRFEWALQSRLRNHPALGLDPREAQRGVHFVQDARFHAPIRPGMIIEARGTICEVRPSRAGALIRYRFRITDCLTDVPLVETRSISILRDVPVNGEARVLDAAERVEGESAPVDLSTARHAAIPVPRALAHIYTECFDIWNPIHTERTVALAAGLPDIILHGTATWALAGRALIAAYGADGMQQLSRHMGRFTGNVLLPDTLTVRHRRVPESDGSVDFDVRRSDGSVVIAGGRAEFTRKVSRATANP